jgi:8-oxo-dGTP pyrophosphatase MutT (NUDIX family)
MVNRRAARVILFDEQDRVLLFRGIDSTTPDADTWWFTPGGGLEPGETPRDAAVREVMEETGVQLPSVAGPVFARHTDFIFEGEPLHQYEEFFVAHVAGIRLSTDGWSELEKRTMLESRWWSLEDLESTTEKIYPPELAHLVRTHLSDAPPAR